MEILNKIKRAFTGNKDAKAEKEQVTENIPVFDCDGVQIQVGHVCIMKSGVRPESKTGYYVGIRPLDSSYYGCKTGLQTYIPDMHSAALHEYWSKCLQIVGFENTHGHLLFNQEI